MTDQHAATDAKFFPNFARFVRSCAPDTLTHEQLTRIEGGNLLYGERVRVTNLNILADHWWSVRKVIRDGNWGNLFPNICTDEAWLDEQALTLSSCLLGIDPEYNELSALLWEWAERQQTIGETHPHTVEAESLLREKFADLDAVTPP